MQNMIKRIVDMDKQARELTDEARARKAGSAEAIKAKKDEVRRNYLELAQRRVEAIKLAEIKDAELQWQEIEARNRETAERLAATAAEHREEWIDEIVRRATGRDSRD